MPLLPINPPPGLFKNGTPYTRKGRWTDGNLMRYHDGSWRPIGGWVRRQQSAGLGNVPSLVADATLEAVRDVFSWRDNSQAQNIVFGSNLGLYHLSGLGVVTDITYAGYTPNNSSKDAVIPTGYGRNTYGAGAYGVANNLTGQDALIPDRWYFDNFGEVLLTGVRNNGGVYELDLSTLTLSLVSGAPTDVQDICVTEQRQVLAIGGAGTPRRVQASDVEDRTDWTPAVANQAEDRELPGTGRLLRCVSVLGQVLILGENDAHAVRYIGPPYVYSIDLVGENCGPVAPEALARTDRFAIWWGERNFWIYDGSVQVLPCEVIDFLYEDIDPAQISKICAFTNADYTEIWWLYQSGASTTGEVDSYVAWDYETNAWYTGRINRTAGIDKGVTRSVIMVDNLGNIWNHELEDTLPDGDVFIETGAISLGNGEKNMAIRYIYPDAENGDGVEYRLITRQLPNGPEYTFGPYAFSSSDPIPTTGVLGREVKLRIDLTLANSEAGTQRLEYAPVGTGNR